MKKTYNKSLSEQFENHRNRGKIDTPNTHIQYMTRSNRKIVVRGTIDTSYTHMHDHSLF